MATTADANSSVWQTMMTPGELSKEAAAAAAAAAATIVTDTVPGYAAAAAAAANGTTTASASSSNTYYAANYPNGYTMYASAANPATYYQQVASNLRAQNAAVAFPYGLAANAPYYGTYPVDYTAYNNQYYPNIRSGYYNQLNQAAAYASVANSLTNDGNLSSESSSTGINNGFVVKEAKKPKAKKKKAGSCSPGDETYARVFIWDIDDVTMLSRNIIAHVTQQFPHLASSGIMLHQLIERIVALNFGDLTELQEGDVVNIEDAVVDESIIEGPIDNLRGLDLMRRVAPKYSALRQFYQEISSKQSEPFKQNSSVINYDLLDRCGMSGQEGELTQAAIQLQTLFNQRWHTAFRCLDLVTKRSSDNGERYANVVLSSEGVAYAAAQLLVSGQSGTVPIDNIYSTTKTGKESILEKIQSRFGKKCSFVSITSSPDTTAMAKKLSIPVWPVAANDDLEKLYTAQRDFLLG